MNILNPMTWLYILMACAVVGGSGYLYGRNDGAKLERVEWQTKEKLADDAAAAKLKTLTDDAIKKERANADALAAVSGKFQQELKNEQAKKDRVISALRAGTIRLFDPNGKCAGIGIAVPETGPSASRRDGSAGTEFPGSSVGVLSSRASEFLIEEASRADKIARQLSTCQAVIVNDRN